MFVLAGAHADIGDQPGSLEQLPAVHAAIVRGRGRILALAPRRCRHLGRARADQIEGLPAHGLEAVPETHLEPVGDAVQDGVGPRALDGGRHHVGGDDPAALPRGKYRREPDARAELEHGLAGAKIEVAAEEERARLGRLDAVGDAESATAVEKEEQARVGRHGLPMTLRK